MIVEFKTNIKISSEGQAQILEILDLLSKKFTGLYYSEEDGIYKIKIDNAFAEYLVTGKDPHSKVLDIAKLKNDIEEIIKNKFKDLVISDTTPILILNRKDISLRDVLLKRFESKVNSSSDKEDKLLRLVILSTKTRLLSIKDRYDQIFQQYKEFSFKKIKSESGRIMAESMFGPASHFGSGHTSPFSGFLHSPYSHMVRGKSRDSSLDMIEQMEAERRKRIDEQNRELEIESRLHSKQESTVRKIRLEQERTLINFFDFTKKFEEKSIEHKEAPFIWAKSFDGHSSTPAITVERSTAKEGEKQSITVTYFRSTPPSPSFGEAKVDELSIDSRLLLKQINKFFEFKGCEINYYPTKNIFSLSFIEASVDTSPLSLRMALIEAGLEKLYICGGIKIVNKPKLEVAPKPEKAALEESKLTSKPVSNEAKSDSNSTSASRRPSFGSPISAMGDAHAALMNELEPYKKDEFSVVFTSLNAFRYGQALRRCCTDPSAIEIQRILLKHSKTLKFDINEKAGAEEQAAIHIAAKKGLIKSYNLLVEFNADLEIKDKAGHTGLDYLKEILPFYTPRPAA